jgi:hypothetical protein
VGSGSGMVAVQPYVALLKALVGAVFALDSLASIVEEPDSISFFASGFVLILGGGVRVARGVVEVDGGKSPEEKTGRDCILSEFRLTQ